MRRKAEPGKISVYHRRVGKAPVLGDPVDAPDTASAIPSRHNSRSRLVIQSGCCFLGPGERPEGPAVERYFRKVDWDWGSDLAGRAPLV